MDFFDAFSLLLATALLTSGFLRRRIGDIGKYRKALAFFVTALILYYAVSAIFGIGVYLSFVGRPLGFVLGVLSLRFLCLALFVQIPESKGDKKDVV
jgi:hypothetical protein